MRCEECLPLIESFFEGTLDEKDARQVGTHIASCSTCSDTIEEIQEERALYQGYWREANVVSPQWGAVLAGLKAERNAPPVSPLHGLFSKLTPSFAWVSFNPAPVAAMLFVCLGLGLLFFINQKNLSTQPELAVVNGGGGGAARPVQADKGAGDVNAASGGGDRTTTGEARAPVQEAEGAEGTASLDVAQKSPAQPMRRRRNDSEVSLKELRFRERDPARVERSFAEHERRSGAAS
jgi:hypothetical protein